MSSAVRSHHDPNNETASTHTDGNSFIHTGSSLSSPCAFSKNHTLLEMIAETPLFNSRLAVDDHANAVHTSSRLERSSEVENGFAEENYVGEKKMPTTGNAGLPAIPASCNNGGATLFSTVQNPTRAVTGNASNGSNNTQTPSPQSAASQQASSHSLLSQDRKIKEESRPVERIYGVISPAQKLVFVPDRLRWWRLQRQAEYAWLYRLACRRYQNHRQQELQQEQQHNSLGSPHHGNPNEGVSNFSNEGTRPVYHNIISGSSSRIVTTDASLPQQVKEEVKSEQGRATCTIVLERPVPPPLPLPPFHLPHAVRRLRASSAPISSLHRCSSDTRSRELRLLQEAHHGNNHWIPSATAHSPFDDHYPPFSSSLLLETPLASVTELHQPACVAIFGAGLSPEEKFQLVSEETSAAAAAAHQYPPYPRPTRTIHPAQRASPTLPLVRRGRDEEEGGGVVWVGGPTEERGEGEGATTLAARTTTALKEPPLLKSIVGRRKRLQQLDVPLLPKLVGHSPQLKSPPALFDLGLTNLMTWEKFFYREQLRPYANTTIMMKETDNTETIGTDRYNNNKNKNKNNEDGEKSKEGNAEDAEEEEDASPFSLLRWAADSEKGVMGLNRRVSAVPQRAAGRNAAPHGTAAACAGVATGPVCSPLARGVPHSDVVSRRGAASRYRHHRTAPCRATSVPPLPLSYVKVIRALEHYRDHSPTTKFYRRPSRKLSSHRLETKSSAHEAESKDQTHQKNKKNHRSTGKAEQQWKSGGSQSRRASYEIETQRQKKVRNEPAVQEVKNGRDEVPHATTNRILCGSNNTDSIIIIKADKKREEEGNSSVLKNIQPAAPQEAPKTSMERKAIVPHCVALAALQDGFVFHPLTDRLGAGAYAKVYAALPIFRGRRVCEPAMESSGSGALSNNHEGMSCTDTIRDASSSPSSSCCAVALKVIPRVGSDGSSTAVMKERHNNPEEKVEERQVAVNRRRELQEVEREVLLLCQLRHTGCARYLGAFKTPHEFAIAMALHPGSINALGYLQLYGIPSENRTRLLLFQLLTTVAYLHDTFGVLHRDIKLENVVVSAVLHPPSTGSFQLGRKALQSRKEVADDEEEQGAAWQRWVSAVLGEKRVSGEEKKKDAFMRPSPASSPALMLRATLIDFGLARRIPVPVASANGGPASVPSRRGETLTCSYPLAAGQSIGQELPVGGSRESMGAGVAGSSRDERITSSRRPQNLSIVTTTTTTHSPGLTAGAPSSVQNNHYSSTTVTQAGPYSQLVLTKPFPTQPPLRGKQNNNNNGNGDVDLSLSTTSMERKRVSTPLAGSMNPSSVTTITSKTTLSPRTTAVNRPYGGNATGHRGHPLYPRMAGTSDSPQLITTSGVIGGAGHVGPSHIRSPQSAISRSSSGFGGSSSGGGAGTVVAAAVAPLTSSPALLHPSTPFTAAMNLGGASLTGSVSGGLLGTSVGGLGYSAPPLPSPGMSVNAHFLLSCTNEPFLFADPPSNPSSPNGEEGEAYHHPSDPGDFVNRQRDPANGDEMPRQYYLQSKKKKKHSPFPLSRQYSWMEEGMENAFINTPSTVSSASFSASTSGGVDDASSSPRTRTRCHSGSPREGELGESSFGDQEGTHSSNFDEEYSEENSVLESSSMSASDAIHANESSRSTSTHSSSTSHDTGNSTSSNSSRSNRGNVTNNDYGSYNNHSHKMNSHGIHCLDDTNVDDTDASPTTTILRYGPLFNTATRGEGTTHKDGSDNAEDHQTKTENAENTSAESACQAVLREESTYLFHQKEYAQSRQHIGARDTDEGSNSHEDSKNNSSHQWPSHPLCQNSTFSSSTGDCGTEGAAGLQKQETASHPPRNALLSFPALTSPSVPSAPLFEVLAESTSLSAGLMSTALGGADCETKDLRGTELRVTSSVYPSLSCTPRKEAGQFHTDHRGNSELMLRPAQEGRVDVATPTPALSGGVESVPHMTTTTTTTMVTPMMTPPLTPALVSPISTTAQQPRNESFWMTHRPPLSRSPTTQAPSLTPPRSKRPVVSPFSLGSGAAVHPVIGAQLSSSTRSNQQQPNEAEKRKMRTSGSRMSSGVPHTSSSSVRLLLTPCGTERYLPPEMLDWVLSGANDNTAMNVNHYHTVNKNIPVPISSTTQSNNACSVHLGSLNTVDGRVNGTLPSSPTIADAARAPAADDAALGGRKRLVKLVEAHQMDLYAVGMVAHVLLSGLFPFNAASRPGQLQQKRHGAQCNSAAWSSVSREAVSVVQWLLHPDPAYRATSAAEVLRHPFFDPARTQARKLGLVPHPDGHFEEDLEAEQIQIQEPEHEHTQRRTSSLASPSTAVEEDMDHPRRRRLSPSSSSGFSGSFSCFLRSKSHNVDSEYHDSTPTTAPTIPAASGGEGRPSALVHGLHEEEEGAEGRGEPELSSWVKKVEPPGITRVDTAPDNAPLHLLSSGTAPPPPSSSSSLPSPSSSPLPNNDAIATDITAALLRPSHGSSSSASPTSSPSSLLQVSLSTITANPPLKLSRPPSLLSRSTMAVMESQLPLTKSSSRGSLSPPVVQDAAISLMNSVAPTAQEEKRNKREGYQTSEAGGKTEMHLTSFQAISTTNRVVSSISSKGAVELHLNSGDGVVLKPNDNSEPDALTPISMSPPNRSTSTFTRVIHPPPPPKTKPNVDSEAQERETPPVVLQRQQTTRSADDEDDDDMFGELYAAIVV